jgi:NifU-like protein involved in Fe-S cluster formation
VTQDPYSGRVRELFAQPAHAGCIADARSVRLDDQGVRVCLCGQTDGDTIKALGFRAWGCPHLIAAAEAFCAEFEGRPAAELLEFAASGLMESLSVPVEKSGRILVLEDAVRALGKSLSDESN